MLKYRRLETEWNDYCGKGSVLYFFTHGDRGRIWLREDEGTGLLTLKEWPNCEGRHIHFGGCDAFSKSGCNLKDLMDYAGAAPVSGYAAESGWQSWDAPASALEILLFGLLADASIARTAKDRPQKLRNIKRAIAGRFPDCKFDMPGRRCKRS